MSLIPGELKYLSSHEWVRLEEDGETVTIGITDHAQDLLGDVVFVELPEVDAVIEAGEEAGVVESVKAASDIFSPVGGTVLETNEGLEDSPETVNSDPYDDGWFFKLKISDPQELEGLLSADEYKEICEAEEH
ncbi:glycine cleavage system protein H [Oleiphilus sp. HI0081]|jgi:glycine cleavage system H protein|uniref:glycine cleavage system protein GcvH n=2 Tax=Oleiphilus TaxID=141450 RepID=UPI0007C26578|nr:MULTISPECIES: glycine cleavage system protein GcvH [unclassified Oleiphilus]KZY40468.1 glycine cleavage system protein H [Oleiphilus sp. HI0050]KZY76485.1 glycine cleavage system protein H [Oleiphilus sp. HI0068]KZY85961.1 glycine cleavage system protein H [Oleiphilus sp. HI0069]KZY89336.1 glycine cleavage system protein H [Oleiphilus sp. HI0072]KZZ09645.1 glycine cleavage system protein H [Oleiphilus sp. HI0078]KZZ19609.1 glycine cleavage system protein H [Oleiphilus sp. HI0081]